MSDAMRGTGQLHDGFVPGRYLIDAYGAGGFRFADMSHRGSILALPTGVRAWDVADPAGITEASLAPALEAARAGELDLLLVGTGADVRFLPEPLRARLRAAGIGLDVMQTGAAARTYNVLAAENRKVGAALIAVP